MKTPYGKILIATNLVFILISCGGDRAPKNEIEVYGIENNTEEEKAISAEDKALIDKANMFFKQLPPVAENPENPVTDAKVTLGHYLYFDTNLSNKKTMSCNTCHNLETYGVDNLPVSKGEEGKNGERNSPTVYNAALQIAQFWDGRAKDVEEQAGGPILNPVEMNVPSKEFLEKRLASIPFYQKMFKEVFPESENPITYENVQKAIGAFERKLLTPAPFDEFLAGNADALTNEQKEGLKTFIEVGCTTCHIGVNLGGSMFQKFGLHHNYWDYTKSENIDEGKYTVSKSDADKYVFKVAPLRNVAKTYPYFHDGSVKDLNEAVKIMAKTQLDKDLTEEETAKIVAFLNSLTGQLPEQFIKAPKGLADLK
jgi:cytochrome c peroxidase